MRSKALAALVAGFAVLPQLGLAAGLFGHMEFKANRIESIPKWVEVLGRVRAEWPQLQDCMREERLCVSSKQRAWRGGMTGWRRQGVGMAQLRQVNTFFNSYPYITDGRLLGVSDYWQTPNQFIERSGDCEDYAIAKFFTLKELGWNPEDMRLVVVHDSVRDIPHAVLGVKVAGVEYILDNLSTQPLPENRVLPYSPYYAVNETSRWVFVKAGGGIAK